MSPESVLLLEPTSQYVVRTQESKEIGQHWLSKQEWLRGHRTKHPSSLSSCGGTHMHLQSVSGISLQCESEGSRGHRPRFREGRAHCAKLERPVAQGTKLRKEPSRNRVTQGPEECDELTCPRVRCKRICRVLARRRPPQSRPG